MLGVTQEPWTTLRRGRAARQAPARGRSSRCSRRIEKTLEELRAMSTGNDSAPTPPPAAAPKAAGQPAAVACGVGDCQRAMRAAAFGPAASDGHIAIDDFMKVELRVAKVLEAEAVPKSKKLIKLKVDVGDRAADDRRRHRRGLSAGAARRPDDRHRRQPEAGQADGHRVERDGAGGQPRGRPADAASRSTSASRRIRGVRCKSRQCERVGTRVS